MGGDGGGGGRGTHMFSLKTLFLFSYDLMLKKNNNKKKTGPVFMEMQENVVSYENRA